MSASEAKSPSIGEIEESLSTRMQELTRDLESLGARFNPQSLKSQATQVKDKGLAQAKARSEQLRGEVNTRLQARRDSLGESAELPTEAEEAAETSIVEQTKDRASLLLNDARDGDPTSLAILAGAAGALVAVTTLLIVKAVK